jgi:glycosyltransferase involved in cell wall biosynthesis
LLQFKYSFLLKGPQYKGRVFRFWMLKTIKRVNHDIILGYEYSFTTQYLILLKRLGLIHQKIGSTVDDSIDICNHVQSKIRFLARQYSVNRLDYMVVFSNEVSQYYQNTFNLKDSQIVVSPILQNTERLRSKPKELEITAKEYALKYNLKGKKVLLFIGRFIPEKALPRFVSTISSLLLNSDDTVLVLVGDGEERQEIEAIVKAKNLKKKVLLPGRFEGSELHAWYLSASGFVLPSTYEPFGAVVNEALIFGLKVLCSQYAGATSLIREDNGMVFDPLSEKEAIERLNIFLNLIDVVENIELSQKPTLMLNHQADFGKEWGKLIVE